MTNQSDQPDVPHKGWICVDVFDLRGDRESTEETNYGTSQMWAND